MRLKCGPTFAQKIAAKETWHDWFAWWPVRTLGNTCVWLEWCRRKGKYYSYPGDWRWEWEYDVLPPNNQGNRSEPA